MTAETTTQQTEMARVSIGAILDGGKPNGATPAQLGQYGDLYAEMVRAWEMDRTAGAQRVFTAAAARNPAVAALRAADPEPRQRAWTADELLDATFKEPRWTVPGILPAGLCFLGGRPKQGKSWMALQMAMAVGAGGRTLDRDVAKGRVLYLALEDGPRRLQSRLVKQRTQRGAQVDFYTEWEPLPQGGTADLITAIDRHGYVFIVIDTLSRALGRADQMDLTDMNMVIGSLQRIAIDRDVTMLLIDHHRKSADANADGDVVNDMMGSTGKTGVADAVLGIYRVRGQRDAVLKMTGRDVEEQEFAINFDAELGCWQMLGNAGAVKTDTVQASIVTALTELGGTAATSQIAKWLGKKPENITRELAELVTKGIVVRGEKRGKEVPYTLAGGEK